MDVGDAVQLIYDEFSDFEGIGPVRMRNILQQAYNKLARRYRFTTMRYTEESSWVSGSEHDPSSDLTRWRGKPESVSSSGEQSEWARREPIDIQARVNSASGSRNDYWHGRLAYCITGPDNKIKVVNSRGAGETLTITHYAGPKTFTADSDVVDLPDEYLYMPIILGKIEVWKIVNNNQSSAAMRKTLPDTLKLELSEFDEMKSVLEYDLSRAEGVIRDIPPSKLIRQFNGVVSRGRGGGSGYGNGVIV